MCSPYLTGSLGVMLVLVSFNYWSVSTQNYDLLTRIQQMQSQLAIGSEKIEEIEKKEETLVSSLRTKDSDLSECRNEKNELKKQNTYQRTSREKAEERLREETEKKKAASSDKESLQTDVNRLTEEKDALQVQIDTLHEDLVKSDNRTAELGHKLEEIRAQYNQNRNQEELKEEGFKVANVANKIGILEGQLPDVNPAAVKIERAKNEGTGLHLVPLNDTIKAEEAGADLVDNVAEVDLSKDEQKIEDVNSINGTNSKSTSTTKKSVGLAAAEQVAAPVEAVEVAQEKIEPVDTMPDLGDDPDQGSPLGQERVERENVDEVNPDKGEADNQRPLYENGPNGRDDLADDDQDPGGDDGNGDSLEDLAENLKNGDEDVKENHDDYDLGERTE